MEFFVLHTIILASINFVIVNSFYSKDHDIRDLLRKKRSLLFPNPLDSETKIQVLFGLGLPMEGEVSMTLGYVLKCNYDLPYNASNFTDGPYVRYARATRRDKISKALPSSSKEIGTISRWALYRILEIALESGESDGKACLLRAVCESAEVPFHQGHHYGILGEILHVLLTPSTTSEEYEIYANREYHAAETIGRGSNGEACRMAYRECHYSPLNYFTATREFLFS